MYSISKMDSYDEVHDVKNGRNIATPPDNSEELDLDVSSAIKFVQSEDEEREDERKFIPNEVRQFNKFRFLILFIVPHSDHCRLITSQDLKKSIHSLKSHFAS